ncbi:MAG: hypothetical protein A2W90_03305 [Bacteroidetes bacterium GWF2_42_66]|nr:MAG: hypothetical protein A2W92_10705 [Bacteroidetes bacterium GWA2_42_15]OFY01362.1 MAG: hypothetical protein A2W89_16790 [Bacteroidetes bacterium GWE2_42_39]OFY42206.1 MAG: hypothetical protein A2W90_03305 [Bacteroidetes bacterium GWF2_42_66]HBL77578.1 hypothetical protein [Prolixibacteraceae bacterium]HCB62708.1 hypothetical protein [Bacteroidales bacterium]
MRCLYRHYISHITHDEWLPLPSRPETKIIVYICTMETNFEKYIALRNDIDRLSARLFTLHKKHVQCKKGCDLCCMDYSIFPVEFHYIKNKLASEGMPSVSKPEDENTCIFLKNHECTIYEHRPVICRTHGLPFLYVNSETEEWELSACELNFTDFNDFDAKNTFPQDKFNSRLFLLNEEFIKSPVMQQYGKFDLVPIRELI